jgi:predicted phage-related endonuclease
MIRNNPDCPFAFATLDGELYDGRHGILEIKTTEIMRSNQWAEWDGKIPQHYYIQIVHQLLATGYDFAILKARIKHTDRNGAKQATIRHYHIERADVLEDIKWLAEREKRFWTSVETDKRPNQILPQL